MDDVGAVGTLVALAVEALEVVVLAAEAVLAAAAVVILAVVAPRGIGEHMFDKLKTILKHLWLDSSDAQRAIPLDLLQRLAKRVAASEGRHTGQIRIYVEAALPMSYLWRLGRHGAVNCSIKELIRQRAVMLFGKLRIWDTEHNNGVLIYLLLAEHAIEIVADRGVNRQVTTQQWQAITENMANAFKSAQFEDGLTQAIGEVTSLLVAHFPSAGNVQSANELADEPILG